MTTPTPPVATAPAPGSSGSTSSSGSPTGSPVFTLAIELLGVIILAVIAGIGPRTGKVVALFVVGLLVLWLVLNSTTLAKLIPGKNVSVQG